VLLSPSGTHWLGTDNLGRDVLARVIWGTRVSLIAGIASVEIAMVIGSLLGLTAGFTGGRFDSLVMRLMDAVLSFPPLMLALALGAVMGAGLLGVVIVLGVVYTPTFARLMRGQVLTVREREYVHAARALGLAGRRAGGLSGSTSCPTWRRRTWCRRHYPSPSQSWPKRRCRSWGWVWPRQRRRGAA